MKTPLRILITLIIAVGAGWLSGDRVVGFSFFQFGGANVVWPGAQSLRFLSPGTFPEGSEPDILIQASMGQWSSVPLSTFQYSFSRLAQDPFVDHFDGFSDTAAVPAATLDPGVLGVTFLVNSGAQWFDMDIFFSDLPEGVGWHMETNPGYDVTVNPTPDNGFSFFLVALHELGHAIGMGHDPIGDEPPGASWFIQTMNPRYPNGGPVGQQHIIELHSDDRNGSRFLYPNSGPSPPPVVDLANASYTSGATLGKPEPVWFDTPGVLPEILPGEQLTVRSVIENFGTTNEFSVRQGFYLSTDGVIDTGDLLIADLLWDIAFEDAIEFEAVIDMPADIAAGSYFVGSILDDLDAVTEAFEDNNAVVYQQTLTVNQLLPAINPVVQEIISCGQPYTGPTPTVTLPLNMSPITWSIDNLPLGMTIDPITGVISWPSPLQSPFLYQLIVRATNGAGTATTVFSLGVTFGAPAIVPIADEALGCQTTYTGPTPQITVPACMEPILNWSLDFGPPFMAIDHGTGVVSWAVAVPSPTPYTITIRATNANGNGTETWLLTVTGGADVDEDGDIDDADVGVFAAVLLGQDTDPNHVAASDLDGSGLPDGGDIQPFVDCFLAG